MATSAAIRLQVETALAKRVPAALTLKIKQAPELFSTGIAEVDAVLGGGIPRGSITEVAGAAHIVMKRLLWLRMSSDRKKAAADKPWSRLEQGLTATDLLLQAGGFGA